MGGLRNNMIAHGSTLLLWIVSTQFLLTMITTAEALITYPLVPQHVQRRRRLSDRRDLGEMVSALYQGYGTHYIDLWCGSPPQRQTVIVDTGSGITAFPCSGCRDCGVPKYHIDQLFNENESTTFQRNTCDAGCLTSRSRCATGQCAVTMSYAEGSRWDAFEAVDNCYVGGPHEQPLIVDNGGQDDLDPLHASHFAFDLVFGCQTLLTGLFKTQLADGIMGMNSRQEAYWYQMYKAGKMQSQQFSLCFSRSPIAERKGTEAGALTLGGVEERLHTSPMVYTPNAGSGRDGFFSVRLRRVWLRDGSAGESAKSSKANPNEGIKALEVSDTVLNTGGIIVDSGTTDTYWNSGIASAFRKVFLELAGRQHSNTAWTLTNEELLALPTILFQLESSQEANEGIQAYQMTGLAGALDPKHPYDVILAFPPSHYMEYEPETDKYTSRFYVTESRGSVLGANAIMGHSVLFDADNDRIGWAESDCDYTRIVTENGYDFPITGTLQTAAPDETTQEPPVTTTPMDQPVAQQPVVSPVEPVTPLTNPTESPIAEAPVPSPVATLPVANTPLPASSSTTNLSSKDVKETILEYLHDCNTPECRFPLIAGMAIIICFGACLSYVLVSCCCHRKGSSDYEYSPAPADEVELSTFQDEPDHEDDEDDKMELQ